MVKYRKWVLVGRLAAIALARQEAARRPLLVREAELAAALQLSRGTLRNYRDALALVRRINDPDIRRALYGMTAASAALMARWLSRSFEDAARFLCDHPLAGPKEIITAERDAGVQKPGRKRRPHPFDACLAGSTEHTLFLSSEIAAGLRERNVHPASEALAILPAAQRERLTDMDRFYRIDYLLVIAPVARDALGKFNAVSAGDAYGELAQAAVIEAGNYGRLEQYALEARAIWARAIAVATRYPLVIVIFPGPASRRRFFQSMPEAMRSMQGQGDPKKGKGKGALPQPPLRLEPSLGVVLFTTRLNAGLDLSGLHLDLGRRVNTSQ